MHPIQIFRFLKRNPILVFVNIPGMAIGLTVVLLLLVYIKQEFSYDQHFETKDRVLRLYNSVTDHGKTTHYGIGLRTAYTDIPMQVPEIESATQIYRGWDVNINTDHHNFHNLDLLYADPGFFDVFNLELLHGDKHSALTGSHQVVITNILANSIFGTENCLGEIITMFDEDYTVSGVIQRLPFNTHFNFDLLASMQTENPDEFEGLEFYTYFLINENADIKQTAKTIESIYNQLMEPWAKTLDVTTESRTELLKNIHMHSIVDYDLSDKANYTAIIILSLIALFVMLIAVINYINIYILHGEKRLSEIATRTTLGAKKINLAKLFYTETGIISLLAFVMAIIMAITVKPYFENLLNTSINNTTFFSLENVLLIISILILLILVSGAYPTLYLTRFNLVNALKGKTENINRKHVMTSTAVSLQMTISVFLITSLIIIYTQVDFLKSSNPGYNPEKVVGFDVFRSELFRNHESIQNELSKLPFISQIGWSGHSMGGGCSGQAIKMYGSNKPSKPINEYKVMPGFTETMQFEIISGRFFSKGIVDRGTLILNESAAKLLELDNPVGKLADMFDEPAEIIGVVKDFHYQYRPGKPIEPLVLYNYAGFPMMLYVRIEGEVTSDKITSIEAVLKNYDPEYFSSHHLLSHLYLSKFHLENQLIKMVTIGAILASIISFIGLMALSILKVNRRTKEIGMRKALGDSEKGIMQMLLKETFILLLISIAIAFIASYLAMNYWLAGFSERIPLHWGYFIVSGIIASFIMLAAVGWQSWIAATKNPVEALRNE